MRTIALTVIACVMLSIPPLLQQSRWYELYDEGVRHVERKEWRLAEEKLNAAKKAGPRPGRRVLRYGMLRAPYLPDFYLAQVYSGLAEEQTDTDSKRQLYAKAIAALAAAENGQVGKDDVEFKRVEDIQRIAKNALVRKAVDTTDVKPVTAVAVEDPTVAPRREIQRLVEQGEKALASSSWDLAVDTWQQANTKLDDAPALRSEFSVIPARVREATLGRDLAAAAQLLQAGRFAAARDAFERAQRQLASGAAPATTTVRALAANVPARLREAQAGEALMTAEEAFASRQWRAAAQAFESARTLIAGVTFSSPQAQKLAAAVPAHVKDATLNAALAERRFADVLALDSTNRAALDGQYARAVDAYIAGRWQDAATEFGLLVKHAPTFRDASDRKIAADIQVAHAQGIAAQQGGDTVAARQYFDTVVQLQRNLRGPLVESKAVILAVEDATDRVRRLDAKAVLATARRQYENGQWEEAKNSVNLVLSVIPNDEESAALIRLLNDTMTGRQVQTLIRSAQEALARGQLTEAANAATELQTLLPQNADAAFVLAEVAKIQSARRQRYQWIAMGLGVGAIGPLLLVSTRNRGRFLAAVGRPTAALRLYDKVLARHPEDGATLQRAAAVSIRNGIAAPLAPRFDAYLKARPNDPDVTRTAADYFWQQGEKNRAIELYTRLLTEVPGTVPPVAFDRLREFYPSEMPASTLAALERARQNQSMHPALVTLLAAQYAAQRRVDAEARDVYRTARVQQPDNALWRFNLAKSLLAGGDGCAAATEAGEAARRAPESPTLDVLADALLRCEADEQSDIAQSLESLALPVDAMLVVAERLITSQASLRSHFSTVYQRAGASHTDLVIASLLRAHHSLDRGDFDSAQQALADIDVAAMPPVRLRAVRDVHVRFLAAAGRSGRTAEGIVARVAQLHAAGREWEAAIRAWQQIVSVPEWNRRSMTAIQDILDSLDTVDVARAYFATSDWHVAGGATGPHDNVARCRVTPGSSESADLRSQFGDTSVFCYSSVVTVDDVVNLKREVLAARGRGEAVAFLVATQAVRHDVYALMYAFMTETPAVTIIPLEAQAMREAIVEARSHLHLERTLHQWLGHTDIYETHNPVSNAATFFGRGHFINQLVLKISRGENFGIFGLRKIGKTSLVYRLRELSRDHLVAYVDLQGVASRRADEVYLRLIESLVRDVRVKYPEVSLPALRLTEATMTQGDVAERFHGDVLALRRALEGSGSAPPHVLLLLDEIELMVPYANSPGFDGHQDFFRHVRGLFQQERFIVSAVVGATPSVCRTAKWGERDNPVFQFYDEVFLAMLDHVECDQMVQGLGELMGVRFDRASLDLVFEQTAGHPYVTRQLCSRLVRLFPDRPLQVTQSMVRSSIEEYLAQRGDYFAGLVEGYLDDHSRRVVETIAMADDEGETRAQLVKVLASAAGPHIVDRVLGDLAMVGIVLRGGDRYTLRAPLFRRWLRRSWLGLE